MQRCSESRGYSLGKLSQSATAAACVVLVHSTPVRAAATGLLSLSGMPLSEGEYVSAFELQTWTVTVLAVCRLPVGWTVTAGNGGDPGGVLSGSANIGAAFVPWSQPAALASMFLVRVGQYRAKAVDDANGGRIPATFAGTATIGRYGQDGERHITLSARNVRHRAAAQCPAPPHRPR